MDPSVLNANSAAGGPESPSTTQEPFRWWPRTKGGRITQTLILIAEYWTTSSEEFGNSRYIALYSTVFTLLICTALRYAFMRWSKRLPVAPGSPWWQNAGTVALAAMVLLFAFFRPTVVGEQRNDHRRVSLEETFQAAMDSDRQTFFQWVHPVGTATSLKVHNVALRNAGSGEQAEVRFTVFWEGPLTKDGFTKVLGIYDKETNRWVRGEVLETNGVTNLQALEGLVGFAAGVLDN